MGKRCLFCIKTKGDFLAALKSFYADTQSLGSKLRGLRSDHGGEFIGKNVHTFCSESGILQTFSGPYAPQQQGISERGNRTLMEMTRCMLLQSGLPKEFWAEALTTAAYLANRLPGPDGISPYFKVFHKDAKVKHLRIFGCRAYVQVTKHARKKLDPKAWRGILVGYDSSDWRCYRVYDPEKGIVRLSVHVSFDENLFPMLGADAENREPISFEDLQVVEPVKEGVPAAEVPGSS